ncbi:peptidylprolyl isomerase [Candidatus Woesearchaeota archaeon]|nr:peptidylprolyl isomerase [Candidatus Woesearchaeota archaeon]
MKTVQKGDHIKVEYSGALDDGTMFDTSKGRAPLEFTVGEGHVIKGFDDAVVGMKLGEEKKIHIDAKEAYGEHNPEHLRKIPLKMLPPDFDARPGMKMAMQAPNEAQFPVVIAEVTADEVTVDFNHPLAGKALNFTIMVVEIEEKKD